MFVGVILCNIQQPVKFLLVISSSVVFSDMLKKLHLSYFSGYKSFIYHLLCKVKKLKINLKACWRHVRHRKSRRSHARGATYIRLPDQNQIAFETWGLIFESIEILTIENIEELCCENLFTVNTK